MAGKLTHVDQAGRAAMVDVGAKQDTARVARAACAVELAPETMRLLADQALPKGDALNTARIAGIQAAKKTAELIPLCHPLALSFVGVDFEVDRKTNRVLVMAEARTTGPTGVEMEALTAASVAALAIYDMVKAVQKDARVTDLRLIHKSGGKSGTYDAG